MAHRDENSGFFAALVGVNGRGLHFLDVQQALGAQAGDLDLFTGIRIWLNLGHAEQFFIIGGHDIAKAGGLLLQG